MRRRFDFGVHLIRFSGSNPWNFDWKPMNKWKKFHLNKKKSYTYLVFFGFLLSTLTTRVLIPNIWCTFRSLDHHNPRNSEKRNLEGLPIICRRILLSPLFSFFYRATFRTNPPLIVDVPNSAGQKNREDWKVSRRTYLQSFTQNKKKLHEVLKLEEHKERGELLFKSFVPRSTCCTVPLSLHGAPQKAFEDAPTDSPGLERGKGRSHLGFVVIIFP